MDIKHYMQQLGQGARAASRQMAKADTAVKNKALPLIMVCGKGIRSNRAVAIAKKLGYENAQSLTGGMGAWRTANLPVEKA